ncbi:SDR family oxidoreductase [Nocardioides marmoribigeumensis]|uniref:NAD(P)-dependent dehydrogenase (Short-subunit alcohol dehydrogenase family) n=1 Tax=Nocardioides marmoribigeumensis TaxID=433649 RepID=A0ABU2C1S1_9ACTN|nr:SDR family oxidoreductase [Nocardioides marmoribigeumensis]MDR7364565.1 NAD(P)-dependent dehydrogenase (short-subunit alcohol dehydrogenase family) [Nocardioides marmoribigeumensis]
MLPIDLAGRVVLVTGGTRGVGRGVSEAFLDAGATVVTCSRSDVADGDLPATDAGRVTDHHACDVRDPEAVTALVDAIVAHQGRLDVLVNNAGGSPYALAADASPRFHSRIVELNLLAPLLLMQAAHRAMARGGVIVNVSSVSGLRPSPGTAAYGAAKAGLDSLTQSLAVEWAPLVRVNALDVGPVLTEQSALHYGDEAGVAAVARTVPMGRLAEPRDVGNAAVWLASDLATHVTGARIELHGGGERPAFLDAATTNN